MASSVRDDTFELDQFGGERTKVGADPVGEVGLRPQMWRMAHGAGRILRRFLRHERIVTVHISPSSPEWMSGGERLFEVLLRADTGCRH